MKVSGRNVQCFHCYNFAPQNLKAEYVHTEFVEGDPDDHYSYWTYRTTFYEVDLCPNCSKITIRGRAREHAGDENLTGEHLEGEDALMHELDLAEHIYDDRYFREVVLYPPNTSLPIGVPESIGKVFLEATKVERVSANAYGVLIGRVLDAVCEDKGAVNGTLGPRLKDLADKGILEKKLLELANALRDLRNIGAHWNLYELTQSEVPLLKDLCVAILTHVYTVPSLAELAALSLDRLRASDTPNDEPNGAVTDLFAKSTKKVTLEDGQKNRGRKPTAIRLVGDIEADMQTIVRARADRFTRKQAGEQDNGLCFIDP